MIVSKSYFIIYLFFVIYKSSYCPKAYYDAVVRWFDDRHRWQIDPRWIIYTNGVVPALSAIIKALAAPSDKIIVQTPAYNCFYSSIRNSGCELSANYLVYRDGRYTIDFDDLETKTAGVWTIIMSLGAAKALIIADRAGTTPFV